MVTILKSKFTKLVDYEKPYITKGSVLRFYTKGFQVEKTIDFMVYYIAENNHSLGLITISGYNAGDILVKFPLESAYTNQFTLSKKWLIENWNKWVCEECDISQTFIIIK